MENSFDTKIQSIQKYKIPTIHCYKRGPSLVRRFLEKKLQFIKGVRLIPLLNHFYVIRLFLLIINIYELNQTFYCLVNYFSNTVICSKPINFNFI